MVCKEEIVLWFKNSESYKRIDVIVELLNMCLPFELRFIGSCLEEMGKHNYQELRGPTINANDFEKLTKDSFFNQGILDENVRHRVLIYLSLLSSRNYSVANWIYKTLLRTDWVEDFIFKTNITDDNVHNEFLLLYVMALHHPAFTFEQKLYYGKVVSHLIDIKENKNRLSPKPTPYGYPPGFGYPTIRSTLSVDTLPCNEEIPPQTGLPQAPLPTQQDYIAWSRPGFPCGAPESVHPPFPAPSMSPLVSQSTSPIHSRSNSPHRTIVSLRTAPIPPSPCEPITVTTLPAPQQIEPSLLTNNYPPFMYHTEGGAQINIHSQEDELNSIPEEKLMNEMSWLAKEMKQPNGLRYPLCKNTTRPPYIIDQLQNLNLDGGGESLHRSNSSSNSSLNQTPPETPTIRTDKSRCNGMVYPGGGGGGGGGVVGGGPICEPTSPPPPQQQQQQQQQPPPTFNNCSVPYTTYPTTFTAIPTNRSMFPYSQSYRPPFSQFPSYQGNDNSYPTYTFPYMSLIYSSPPYPPRNPNCFNCGAIGHVGQDCNGQNIEDITQKKTYTLDFSATLPDTDK